jgi:hypothetical protein
MHPTNYTMFSVRMGASLQLSAVHCPDVFRELYWHSPDGDRVYWE